MQDTLRNRDRRLYLIGQTLAGTPFRSKDPKEVAENAIAIADAVIAQLQKEGR